MYERGRWEGELIHTTKNGDRITVLSRWALQRDEAGTPSAVMEINLDITKGKQAERALQSAYVYNRSLIEAGLDPLVTITTEGKIGDVNAATESITGRARGELIGTDFVDDEPGVVWRCRRRCWSAPGGAWPPSPIPVILCTGYSEAVTPEKAKEAGIRECVLKPLSRKEMYQAIARAMEGID